MKVPFNDLYAQHHEIRSNIDEAIEQTIESSSFVGGHAVRRFEERFAAYCEVEFAIGVSSGTDALRIALQALDVGQGQAVITVPNTFIATVEAIMLVGARPIFVDIDPTAYTMDPASLRAYLNTACRADPISGRPVDKRTGETVTTIIPVHLYGYPADMDAILAIALEFELNVVEDACQAHGAIYYTSSNGQSIPKRAGTFGHLGCFSFYPGKNLGAMGEGGAVITDNPELAEKIHLLRNHGQIEKYNHILSHGANCRLDALQAAILDVKLRMLDEWNARRRNLAALYSDGLGGMRVTIPTTKAYGEHVYHLYVVQVEERDHVRDYLAACDIETGLHYPIPLHLQKALQWLEVSRGNYPVTERMADRLLSLPMFPHMSIAQVEYVCDTLAQAVA